MKKTIRLLLADDHPIFREGLSGILAADERMDLVHVAADGREAYAKAEELQPDVLVLDISMPGMSGLDIARKAREQGDPYRIILLTAYDDEEMFEEAMELGVTGYCSKESAMADVVDCIARVAEGKPCVSERLAEYLLNRRQGERDLKADNPGLEKLTVSERRILKLVASDLTSKEIAGQLGLSPRTVEAHRANICGKLSLAGSHSLLKFAFDHRAQL